MHKPVQPGLHRQRCVEVRALQPRTVGCIRRRACLRVSGDVTVISVRAPSFHFGRRFRVNMTGEGCQRNSSTADGNTGRAGRRLARQLRAEVLALTTAPAGRGALRVQHAGTSGVAERVLRGGAARECQTSCVERERCCKRGRRTLQVTKRGSANEAAARTRVSRGRACTSPRQPSGKSGGTYGQAVSFRCCRVTGGGGAGTCATTTSGHMTVAQASAIFSCCLVPRITAATTGGGYSETENSRS